MALGQNIRQALGFVGGVARAAAAAGQSAFAAIGQYIAGTPAAEVPPALQDTAARTQVAEWAESLAGARNALSAAADDDSIDASMITFQSWSMDLNAYNASPGYHLVVGIKVAGQDEPVYRTITGITDLPPTAGELRAITDANAAAIQVGTTPGGGIGGQYEGIDSITITVGPALG